MTPRATLGHPRRRTRRLARHLLQLQISTLLLCLLVLTIALLHQQTGQAMRSALEAGDARATCAVLLWAIQEATAYDFLDAGTTCRLHRPHRPALVFRWGDGRWIVLPEGRWL